MNIILSNKWKISSALAFIISFIGLITYDQNSSVDWNLIFGGICIATLSAFLCAVIGERPENDYYETIFYEKGDTPPVHQLEEQQATPNVSVAEAKEAEIKRLEEERRAFEKRLNETRARIIEEKAERERQELIGTIQEAIATMPKPTIEQIEKEYSVNVGANLLVPETEEEIQPRKLYKDEEQVDHPDHYTAYSVELIEITSQMSFCLGNAVKYVARDGLKSGATKDLEKALKYIELNQQYSAPATNIPLGELNEDRAVQFRKKAAKVAEEMNESREDHARAFWFLTLGDTHRATEYIEKAIQERDNAE